MKKVFITLMAAVAVMMGVASCKCTPDNQEPVEPAVEQVGLVAENAVSMDKEHMFLQYSENYRYYETTAVLDNYLDADTTYTVARVENVFKALVVSEGSTDTKVVIFVHTLDGGEPQEYEHAPWLGDAELNDEVVKLTFADAIERVFEANCPTPHTRYIVLRKPLYPAGNPKYIFGQGLLFVDAVTGEVTDATGFKMPLGEWP